MVDFRSLLSMFGSKRHLGCDVGASCVKAVKLEKIEKKGLRLLGVAAQRVPDELGVDERAIQINSFLSQNNFLPDGNASVNIEDSTLLIRRMDLPKMPDRDMKTAIRWNFREFVSGSIEDYVVSYQPINGMVEAEKQPVSAFCVARKSVESRQTFMKKVGLKVRSVEPNASALQAAFNYNVQTDRDQYHVVLDLGDSICNFIVIGNRSLMLSRPLTNLYGRKLVDVASKDLMVKPEKAEALLKKYLSGEESSGAEEDKNLKNIGIVVSQFISKLIVDIQRSIDAFCIMYKKDRVDKIHICGGGICLPSIVDRLSSGLGVGVEHFNPFQNILEAESARKMKSAPMYAVAVGLALPLE